MSIVFVLVLVSILVIGSIVLFQTYQGLFSSFVMLVLTAISAAIAFSYSEPLGMTLGKWSANHLYYVLLFLGLITCGALAKSIMSASGYVRLAVGAGAVAFLIIVGSQAKMAVGEATGNSYGQAMALVGLFVVSLLSLRAVFDSAVTGNMTFAWQVERIGGAVLGFFSGLIIMGVVLASWQLLPVGPGIFSGDNQKFYGQDNLEPKRPSEYSGGRKRWWENEIAVKLEVSDKPADGWASYNRYDQAIQLQAAPFPYADSFAVWVVEAMSAGSLGGGQRFAEVHPDFLLEAWANRNGINALSRRAAPGGAVMQAKWQEADEDDRIPNSDKMTGILRLVLSSEASDEDQGGRVMRFRGPQVRMVGQSGKSYWPVGVYLEDFSWSSLYGDLAELTLSGEQGERGYLRYNRSDYFLWGEQVTEQGLERREIRGCLSNRLWWQLQMLRERGEPTPKALPATLGVVQELSKGEDMAINLLFEIEPDDVPDYVVFKRTAFREVTVLRKIEPDTTAEADDSGGASGE